MKFYSGFSLRNELYLFKNYVNGSQYTACGFSYGAIKALHYAQEQLACGKRVDRVDLLSPVFFQTKDVKFKRVQLLSYKKNRDSYLTQFEESCFFPHAKKIVEHSETTIEELEELLEYEWSLQELEELVAKGVKLEVYLGSEDKIIDAQGARAIFLNVATVTYIKNANHFLQTN